MQCDMSSVITFVTINLYLQYMKIKGINNKIWKIANNTFKAAYEYFSALFLRSDLIWCLMCWPMWITSIVLQSNIQSPVDE
jgi:hypothetical protein